MRRKEVAAVVVAVAIIGGMSAILLYAGSKPSEPAAPQRYMLVRYYEPELAWRDLDSSETYVKVWVEVRNVGCGQVVVHPFDIELILDGSQYGWSSQGYDMSDHFDDATLLSGEIAEGWLLFHIPSRKEDLLDRATLKADFGYPYPEVQYESID